MASRIVATFSNMIELLKKIGLEDKETAIYMVCLEHDLNTPTSIASKPG